MFDYLFRLALAVDQLLNVAICNGKPDETMSSAAWRMERDGRFWGFMRPVIDWLFSPFQKDHCQQAYLAETRRAQLDKEFQV